MIYYINQGVKNLQILYKYISFNTIRYMQHNNKTKYYPCLYYNFTNKI